MRKPVLILASLALAACAPQNRPARLPQQEGEILAYRYQCAQGQVEVEYARMGGQDSATLAFTGDKDEQLRKVLPRAGGNAFALDELRWTEQNGQYTLTDGGQTLLGNCEGRVRNTAEGKDDHQGTIKLDLGRIFR